MGRRRRRCRPCPAVAAQCSGRVGGGVGVGDGGPDRGDHGPVDVSARRPERLGDVPAEPHDSEGWIARGGGLDRGEGAGQRFASEVDGVVVGHGRDVDACCGQRGQRGLRRLEGEPLPGLRPATLTDRGLEVDDGDVRGGQGRGPGRQGGGDGIVVQPLAQHALEVDVARHRDRDRPGRLRRLGRGHGPAAQRWAARTSTPARRAASARHSAPARPPDRRIRCTRPPALPRARGSARSEVGACLDADLSVKEKVHREPPISLASRGPDPDAGPRRSRDESARQTRAGRPDRDGRRPRRRLRVRVVRHRGGRDTWPVVRSPPRWSASSARGTPPAGTVSCPP